MKTNNSGNFIHPLSELETISTEQGEKQVVNSWAFASMIWSSALNGNQNALKMVDELFANKHEIAIFLQASKDGNQAMIFNAINILAFALDNKIDKAFESKKST